MAAPVDDRLAPPLGREARAAFVQVFASIEASYPAVAAALQHDQDALLERAMGAALAECDHLRRQVAPGRWPLPAGCAADVVGGPTRPVADGILVAFRWEPAEGGGAFPRLDADLELAPLGPQLSALSVRGRYRRPEPPAGDSEVLLHRIAERTVRAFLGGVCAELRVRAVAGRP